MSLRFLLRHQSGVKIHTPALLFTASQCQGVRPRLCERYGPTDFPSTELVYSACLVSLRSSVARQLSLRQASSIQKGLAAVPPDAAGLTGPEWKGMRLKYDALRCRGFA